MGKDTGFWDVMSYAVHVYNESILSRRLSNVFLKTSQHAHVSTAWVLIRFASVDRVERCCTDLFHKFSLGYSHGNITH